MVHSIPFAPTILYREGTPQAKTTQSHPVWEENSRKAHPSEHESYRECHLLVDHSRRCPRHLRRSNLKFFCWWLLYQGNLVQRIHHV
eukprot:scaffold41222_cov214-Amphora_coffeaeformis.AAC.1